MTDYILFINCKISTGAGNETKSVDILVKNGKIITIDSHLTHEAKIININGNLLVPGAIDPHVHFNDPGFTHHEDFLHGTASAAKGGVTTIIDMPCTSIPPVTSRSNLDIKLEEISKKALVDYALWGGVSGLCFENNTWKKDISELSETGIVGLKTYAISGMNTFTALNYDQLFQVMEHAAALDLVVGHHAEDSQIIEELTAKLQSDGRHDAEAYWLSRPSAAETKACKTAASIAERTGASLHVVHLATAAAIDSMNNSNTTAETCPHYLYFSKEDLLSKGSILKTAPVVKTKEDSYRLWGHLENGKIQFMATDHAPCSIEEKRTGSIWTDYGGIPGTELMLNFAYSEGVSQGRITLDRLIKTTSTNAAMRFGLYPRKGALIPGADADFAIIDTNSDWIVTSDLQSKGKFTPFEGHKFSGRVIATFLRGKKIYDLETGIDYAPTGRWIKKH